MKFTLCKTFGLSQRTMAGSGRHPQAGRAALPLWKSGTGGRRNPHPTSHHRSTPLHPQSSMERISGGGGGGLLELEKKLEQRRCGGVRAGGEKRLLSSRRCAVADHGLVLAAAPSAPWTVGGNRERAGETPGLRLDLHRSSWARSRSPRCCYLRETKKR